MAICLVMELADAPINLFVPIGIAVAVSAFTASRLAKRLPLGIYRGRKLRSLAFALPSRNPHMDAILTWPSGRSGGEAAR